MSRRSLITRPGSQHRAASRMTPGTRMWSEQPVPADPRGRAVVADPEYAPQVLPPTSARIRIPTTITPATGGATQITVLYTGGNSDTPAPTPPAGWVLLGQGTYMGTCPWAVYACSRPSAADPFTPGGETFATYYYGGTEGGRWSLTVGVEYGQADEKIAAAQPPPGSVIWQQMAAIKVNSYINPISGRSFTRTLASQYVACRPDAVHTDNLFQGADFQTHWAGEPYVSPPDWTYYHAGAYGRTGSQALCTGWTP